jgi:cold shock protein
MPPRSVVRATPRSDAGSPQTRAAVVVRDPPRQTQTLERQGWNHAKIDCRDCVPHGCAGRSGAVLQHFAPAERSSGERKISLDLAVEDHEIFWVSIADGSQMSRYKEHRGPKSRGYDEDYTPDYKNTGRQPEYFSPKPKLAQGSEPVEGSVKWFNADKGFGFVIVAGGSDAFLPSRALEAAGHSSVPEGARLKVRISQGPKGPQVAEVLEVDTSTAQVTPSPRPSSQRPGAGPTEECLGSVKWYNAEKGFGFVAPDTGGRDVFLHATTLRRGGLNELAEGQRVRMQISQGQKGPEARSIELLD